MKSSQPDEPQFRTKLTECIQTFLTLQKAEGPGAVVRSEKREGFRQIGVSGFFDYVRKIGSSYLILELKVQRAGRLDSYRENQHLALSAIEQCGVPVRYAWNCEDLVKMLNLEHAETLNKTSTTPVRKLLLDKLQQEVNLKTHLQNLLDAKESVSGGKDCSGALRFASIFAGENQNFNATAFLISVNLIDLEYTAIELTAEFVQEVKKHIEQIKLPAGWENNSVDHLSSVLNGLFLAAISDVAVDTDDLKPPTP